MPEAVAALGTDAELAEVGAKEIGDGAIRTALEGRTLGARKAADDAVPDDDFTIGTKRNSSSTGVLTWPTKSSQARFSPKSFAYTEADFNPKH